MADSPSLLVHLALRRVRGSGVPQDVFTRAGELFAEAELAGESPELYCRRTAAATGLPSRFVANGLRSIRNGLSRFERADAAQMPPPAAGVHWVARGRTLGVVTPSNHADPHLVWARALSWGYGVVVRPGGRDPFTPYRLAAALLAAGLPPGGLALLPGGRQLTETLLRGADLGIVYGGPAVVDQWAASGQVLTRGPGRSAVLLDRPLTPQIADLLAHTVGADAGVRCANTSVIRTSQDVTTVAQEVAVRLDAMPALPANHPDAVLPTVNADHAEQIRRTLERLEADGFKRHSASEGPVPLDDGSYTARPVVLSTADSRHEAIGTEMPFPFVVVTPWSPADGLEVFGRTLVLTVLSDDANLPRAALSEPLVRRVVAGPADPWTSAPELPHDGSLAGFLLEPKALLSGELIP
ncbi:aldehyde dehydrogenase family protein [Micromonospora sp. URMC 105]|uniref:aldehyde dehydrogenase family protein n=1 Tax=Micromonospora sp. URMC 105 TaxID=3423413 RepID=UPI003F1B7B20